MMNPAWFQRLQHKSEVFLRFNNECIMTIESRLDFIAAEYKISVVNLNDIFLVDHPLRIAKISVAHSCAYGFVAPESDAI